MEKQPRHFYSLNMIAYIQACTDLKPTIGLESVDGKLIGYATWPDVAAIDACIKQYHKNPFIHKFISSFKETREEIRRLKGT